MATAVLAVGAIGGPSSAAGATEWPLGNSVIFNNPHDSSAKYAIQNRTIALINSAPIGSTIRVAIYMFDSPAYATALIDAFNRGVNVQVVGDFYNASSSTFRSLQDVLGTDKSRPSFAMTCAADNGCIGTGINHNKFVLFSSTLGQANVVVQSSANMRSGDNGLGNSGINSWNNAVILVDEPAIYDAYLLRFNALRDQARGTPWSSTVGTNAKVYFFPREYGSTLLNILNNIDCSGRNTAGGWGPNHLTSIHVAMLKFSDVDIARKLWGLDNQNCVVHVLRTNVGAADNPAIAELNNCTAHNGVTIDAFHLKVNNDDDPDDVNRVGYLHSKYLVVDGYYDGKPNQRFVWTGSYNYSVGALRSNDETLLKLRHPDLIDAFQANFHTLVGYRDYSTPTADC